MNFQFRTFLLGWETSIRHLNKKKVYFGLCSDASTHIQCLEKNVKNAHVFCLNSNFCASVFFFCLTILSDRKCFLKWNLLKLHNSHNLRKELCLADEVRKQKTKIQSNLSSQRLNSFWPLTITSFLLSNTLNGSDWIPKDSDV